MRPLRSYPFDSYRVAVTDPDAFFGRDELLRLIRSSSFTVRIILGGRRIGKTSSPWLKCLLDQQCPFGQFSGVPKPSSARW